MKRTDYLCCVGKKNGYDEYRTIVTDGERFFVNYKKQLIDVTEEVKAHNIHRKSTIY